MKIAHYLSISMAGIFIVSSTASADPNSPDTAGNPYLQVDADGIPLVVAPDHATVPSPAELEAIDKQKQQTDLNKNWLLRNYEHQLQTHSASDASNVPRANLYYQLSTNKELAKLAGLQDIEVDDRDNASAAQAGMPHTSQVSANLRPATSSPTGASSISHSSLFKPLVTPLSAPEAAGLHNFYSTLATSMASPLSGGSNPGPTPARTEDQVQDSSDIDTPGMIAAEKDPLTDPSATDLTLDILPGETALQARQERENRSKLELPGPIDADQLHKSQAASLSGPVAQGAQPTPATAALPAKPIPVNDEDAPTQVSKEPTINPVRAPIANPYDILNR
jgi:hypothetical protein